MADSRASTGAVAQAESQNGKSLSNLRQRSIVYGSESIPISDEERSNSGTEHTHRWCVYVRGFHDEDISSYVKRVIFRLHESFPNSTRSVESPPFELRESGWGEFSIQIRLVFQDPQQRHLQLTHHLRLYPFDPVTGVALPMDNNERRNDSGKVVAESYEEILFDPASDKMLAILDSPEQEQYTQLSKSSRFQELIDAEAEELQRIDLAIAQVQAQIEEHSHPNPQQSDLPAPSSVASPEVLIAQASRHRRNSRRR